MHTSGSYLYTIVNQARFYLDEVTVDAKYPDAFIVNNLLYPVMSDVLARLNLNQDNPIVVRHPIPLVTNQENYLLPPTCQEIWRLAFMDESGNVLREWFPRGQYNPSGPGWSIEGNELAVRPFPTTAETISVWYVPTASVLCHYGTGYLHGDELVLDDTPTLGMLDKRPNAYAGQVLRVLGHTWQERIILEHEAKQRRVTVRVPFEEEFEQTSSQSTGSTGGTFSGSSTSSGAFTTSNWSSSDPGYAHTVTYEIAPVYIAALWEAVSCGVAVKLAVARGMKQDKISMLEREYRKAMKTIMDNLANLQMRAPKGIDRNTVDHPINRLRLN